MSETLYDIHGLDALGKFMDELPKKVQTNIMRSAMSAGAAVIAKQAKVIAPVEPANASSAYKKSLGWAPGALKKSIRISRGRILGENVVAKVTAGNKQAFYAHMVEFGTAAHWIRPKGAKSLFLAGVNRTAVDHPGARKNPFMRIAMDAEAQRAFQAVANKMRDRLTPLGLETPDTDNVTV